VPVGSPLLAMDADQIGEVVQRSVDSAIVAR
jgi:hypothetical protein